MLTYNEPRLSGAHYTDHPLVESRFFRTHSMITHKSTPCLNSCPNITHLLFWTSNNGFTVDE